MYWVGAARRFQQSDRHVSPPAIYAWNESWLLLEEVECDSATQLDFHSVLGQRFVLSQIVSFIRFVAKCLMAESFHLFTSAYAQKNNLKAAIFAKVLFCLLVAGHLLQSITFSEELFFWKTLLCIITYS